MSSPAARFLAAHRSFVPRRWLANGHVMTVYAWAHRRRFAGLPTPEARLVQVSEDSQVLVHGYWQPTRAARPTLVALHGLEGSSEAHYMLGLADKAFRRGWNAVLVNQRNCGGTEHLTPGLYHSGLTDDPRNVIRALAADDGLGAFAVVGYSLGGNLTMKLAGEQADSPTPPIKAVVAVSPTLDLDLCVRAIERPANFPYQFNFVRHLKARMRRKAAAWPGRFDLGPLDAIRTIRQFDDVYTAPSHGFQGATDYYFRASALRVVSRIRIPALVLTASDDPVVPASQFHERAVADNPNIGVSVEPHGGHCGFAGDPQDGDDGYWAERTAVAFLSAVIGC
jgi:predicted alpha/beta-fold hydrolase